MGYRLQRTDGNLVKSFKVDGHNKAACDAELWYYGFDKPDDAMTGNHSDYICWYAFEGNWHILIAGPEAYRRYAE